MPDITYNQFPISGKIVDFDTLQSDVANLNANAVLESRTINGYDLSANRTIYAQDVPSKNIINPTELVQGSMTSTGTETGGTTRIRSGYVAVTGGTTYTISTSSTTVMIYELHEYNSSKTWQSYTSVSLNSPYTFTTASGTGYVRFLFRYSDNSDILPSAVTNLQLELGSTATAYVPYAKTNVELTNYLLGAVIMEKVTSNDSETLSAGLGSNRIFYIDKAGYTPIGVIGYGGSGTAGISFSDVYIDTIHTAKAYYANNTSSSKTINSLFVQILYIKN